MSVSRAAIVADFFVTWLNDPARAWPLDGWNAQRQWNAVALLEDLDNEFRVDVVADSRASNESANRQKLSRNVLLFLHFRQKFKPTTTVEAVPLEWIDERVLLVEEIDDRLQKLEMTGQAAGFYGFVDTTELSYPDPIDLNDHRQFTASIEIRLRELRTRT